MKFQSLILNFEWTHGHSHGRAQSNMRLQLFQSKSADEKKACKIAQHADLFTGF